MSECQKQKLELKVVYSIRVRNLLSVLGVDYIKEVDNPYKKGFKCWLYKPSSAFDKAFDDIMMGRVEL
jgi:hypothetical protein